MDDNEKLYRIHTDQDHLIELTEKHPILTKSGWKNASSICEGNTILVKPDTPLDRKMPQWKYNNKFLDAKEKW